MTQLILATTSPYRIEAFKFLGLDFISQGSNVDEYTAARPTKAEDLVGYLAKLKAEAVAKNFTDGIVMGFDSVGAFNGKILEKPRSRAEAFDRLKALSGHEHFFHTGLHFINIKTGQVATRVITTRIEMRDLSEAQINRYLDEDPRYATIAIGFDPVSHLSAAFVKNLYGSYNNYLRGIPLEAIGELLIDVGYDDLS